MTHHLRSVSVPSAGASVTRLLSGCLDLAWPCFGSCLVCTFGVPLSSDPLIVSTSTVLLHSTSRLALYPPLLPLPNGVCKYPDPGTSAVERLLNTPTFGGNFELPNYFTSPAILFFFHQLSFPSLVVVSFLIDNCLSALHRLSPAYPTSPELRDQFPQWMPEFKASKVTALAPPV